jgi:hypothetical protein
MAQSQKWNHVAFKSVLIPSQEEKALTCELDYCAIGVEGSQLESRRRIKTYGELRKLIRDVLIWPGSKWR